MTRSIICAACVLAVTFSATACSRIPSMMDALPFEASRSTTALAEMKDDLEGASRAANNLPAIAVVPQFQGIGMAQISRQPGSSLNEKRLMAIRAARLEALRSLVEQVHGISLSSETTLRDTVLRNDSLRGLVEGEIRGARTERITPKGSDSYEVVLTLNPDVVAFITRSARLGL